MTLLLLVQVKNSPESCSLFISFLYRVLTSAIFGRTPLNKQNISYLQDSYMIGNILFVRDSSPKSCTSEYLPAITRKWGLYYSPQIHIKYLICQRYQECHVVLICSIGGTKKLGSYFWKSCFRQIDFREIGIWQIDVCEIGIGQIDSGEIGV